jgi:hypothetical protein
MADFLTFDNLKSRIKSAIKTTQGSKDTLIEYLINMVYLNEVMVADDLYPFYWMVDFDGSRASVAPATITGISKAADGVFTTDAAHGLAVGDIVSIHTVLGMTEVNDLKYAISEVPTTATFKCSAVTTNYTTYTSGGVVHHKGITLNTSGKNVQRILAAGWNDEGEMTEIGYLEREKDLRNHENDSKGLPRRYMHGKTYSSAGVESNQLMWFEGADAAYQLRYWFEARASRLINSADVPLLPPQFHDMIVAGVVTRLAEYNVQVENAVIWPSIYSAQLEKLSQFNRKWWQENDPINREKVFMI